jgi:hypothetical protein
MPKNTGLALRVDSRILHLRNHKVILDSDLAELYRVSVKRLNEQVKRNRERFPTDFLFRLTAKEFESLRSQKCHPNTGRAALPSLRLHRAWGNHGRNHTQLKTRH